jgi:hypothetical protein
MGYTVQKPKIRRAIMVTALVETGKLVHQGDMEAAIAEMIAKEQAIIEDLDKVIPVAETESIRKGLTTRLSKSVALVKALQSGFIPVDSGWFVRTDTRSKWDKQEVEEAMKSMPDEVKEAWERIKELNIFQSYSVSTAGSDPILVGNAGGKHFLIAAWINLEGGFSIGFTVK